jgi:hypothetical protein
MRYPMPSTFGGTAALCPAAIAAMLVLLPLSQAAAASLPVRPAVRAAGQPREAAREAYRNDRWPTSRGQSGGQATERQRWPDGATGAPPDVRVDSRQAATDPDVTGTIASPPRMGGPGMAGPSVQPHAPRAARWDIVPLPPERPW